jgi:hypothetical protein
MTVETVLVCPLKNFVSPLHTTGGAADRIRGKQGPSPQNHGPTKSRAVASSTTGSRRNFTRIPPKPPPPLAQPSRAPRPRTRLAQLGASGAGRRWRERGCVCGLGAWPPASACPRRGPGVKGKILNPEARTPLEGAEERRVLVGEPAGARRGVCGAPASRGVGPPHHTTQRTAHSAQQQHGVGHSSGGYGGAAQPPVAGPGVA